MFTLTWTSADTVSDRNSGNTTTEDDAYPTLDAVAAGVAGAAGLLDEPEVKRIDATTWHVWHLDPNTDDWTSLWAVAETVFPEVAP